MDFTMFIIFCELLVTGFILLEISRNPEKNSEISRNFEKDSEISRKAPLNVREDALNVREAALNVREDALNVREAALNACEKHCQKAASSSGTNGPGPFTCPLEPQFLELPEFFAIGSLLVIMAIVIGYFLCRKIKKN